MRKRLDCLVAPSVLLPAAAQAVRHKTLEEMAKRNDDWLYEVSASGSNTYYKWFHVMEDEINHRGQILLLKKRLPR